MGQNSRGETGLFPSNYVELIPEESSAPSAGARAVPPPAPPVEEAVAPPPAGKNTSTATAQYDYEAAEDNELSFPDGAKITDVVSVASNWLYMLERHLLISFFPCVIGISR